MRKKNSNKSFLKECTDELKKVSYPTKQETVRATFVTIIMVLFIACTLAVFDVLFDRLMLAIMS